PSLFVYSPLLVTLSLHLSFSIFLHPPRSPLFPYTALFRSEVVDDVSPAGVLDVIERVEVLSRRVAALRASLLARTQGGGLWAVRSEEHTSALQSRFDSVCRLLLGKKKNTSHTSNPSTEIPC